MMRVWLSLRKLSLKLTTVVKLRFWGKILGTQGSYYIAEGEFEPGADPDGGVPGPFDAWRPYSVPSKIPSRSFVFPHHSIFVEQFIYQFILRRK